MHSKFTFSSSIDEDIWHPKKNPDAYEWWYFDALSDDGTESIVINFLDNYVFSPNYNSQTEGPVDSELHTTNGHSPKLRFPAVSFAYYQNGKAIYRTINEYPSQNFHAKSTSPECSIGKNSFRFRSAPYGTGYNVSIDINLGKRRRLIAQFEWLLLESDFLSSETTDYNDRHRWNLVAPRSDVTGKITVIDRNGSNADEKTFRGTGYHDHNFDDRLLPDTVKSLQRGRVHFPDSTAVYYRYRETGTDEHVTKLFIVRDGKHMVSDATSDAQSFSRNLYGLRYPERLQINGRENARLRIKQKNIIESTSYQLRFLSEMTLSLNDGKPRKGIGITEHLSPKPKGIGWLGWLIGKRF